MPRLKLNEIRVESFVTAEQKKLKGGSEIDPIRDFTEGQCTIDFYTCPYSHLEC